MQPAPGNPGPQNDPANHRAQQHDQGGRGEREEDAVPDRRAHARISDHRPIGVEREVAQRRHARHAVEPLQRRPDEHQERQDESEQRIADEKGRGEIAPPPEIDHARAEPLAGDGRISLALAAEPRLPVDAARGDGEQRDGIGGGEPDIARIAVDRLVDRGGEDLDADRQAEQRRQLEGFDRPHEQDEERCRDRRRGELQRDPSRQSPGSRRRSSSPIPRATGPSSGKRRSSAGKRSAHSAARRPRSCRGSSRCRRTRDRCRNCAATAG